MNAATACGPRPVERGFGHGTVEVWQLALAPGEGPTTVADGGVLSAAERCRAAGLVSERNRVAFVVTRTVVRKLLASRLGCHPAQVAIAVTRHGKPVVGEGTGREAAIEPWVHFNVSHTAGRSLVVLADRPVGVDIERTDRSVDVERAGELVLTGAERRHLRGLDPAARTCAFFALWARKEAVTKGVGLGLRLPFRTVDCRNEVVTVELPTDDRDGDGDGEDSPAGSWHVVDLAADWPYVAAVAVRGPRPRIHWTTWYPGSRAATGGHAP
jgi:4'-phosphopantetheinyl transferase